MKLNSLAKSKYLFIFLLIIVFLFYKMNRLLYSSQLLDPSLGNSYLEVNHLMSSTSSRISSRLPVGQFRILLWTKYFGTNDWTKLRLNTMNCSFSNCLLTNDRIYLPDSDAVLFHWRDIDNTDLPPDHKSGQKWVLYNWEPPHFTYEDAIKPLVNDIDWMMTYRTDSDIFVPYGVVQKCSREWNNEDLFEKKTKSVAWIVSNCMTPGNREGIVKELTTFIDVDIFGGCGQKKCEKDESCYQMIENNYKFYLSFENSLCKDYITEKLFRTIDYDIIPIVYGSADYKSLLPNNSFIDVNDFRSLKELSDYLKVVASDKHKYNSYLVWKKSYCVRQTEYRYFCNLCKKLNENSVRNANSDRVFIESHNQSEAHSEKKGLKWWYEGSQCQHRNAYNSIAPQLKIFTFVCFSLIFIVH